MKISINILNYNTFEKSKNCIDSCLKQKGVDFEIVLIDNSSTDDSYRRLKKEYKGKITFLQNEQNYGYAEGNNIGINYCKNKGVVYTLILNSDTVLKGEYLLKKLINTIEKYPNVAIVSPQIFNVSEEKLILNKNENKYLAFLRIMGILPTIRYINSDIEEISESQGSALLVNNDTFLQIGGFPTHYFMYGEEGTLCKKIQWINKRILWYKSDQNYVLHYHDKSKKIDNWRHYLMGRNQALEFYENNDKFKLRWGVVFLIFKYMKYLHYKNFSFYLTGMQDAKKIKKSKLSKEEIKKSAIRKIEELKC